MDRSFGKRRFALSLALLVGLVVAVGAAWADEAAQDPAPYEFPIQVDTVEVEIRESYPVQIAVIVDGVVGDGCTRFERVEQWQEENRVFVRILGQHSGWPVCTMIALLYHDTIDLEGSFEPGEYAVEVNGLAREFRVD